MNYCSAGQKCARALERDLRLSHCFVRRWRLAEQTAVDGWTRSGLAEKSVDDFVVDWPSQSECSAAQKSVKHTERGKKGHAACARFVLCQEAQGVCFYSSGVERMDADGKYRFVLYSVTKTLSEILRFSSSN
jgi:hypothetical protein